MGNFLSNQLLDIDFEVVISLHQYVFHVHCQSFERFYLSFSCPKLISSYHPHRVAGVFDTAALITRGRRNLAPPPHRIHQPCKIKTVRITSLLPTYRVKCTLALQYDSVEQTENRHTATQVTLCVVTHLVNSDIDTTPRRS